MSISLSFGLDAPNPGLTQILCPVNVTKRQAMSTPPQNPYQSTPVTQGKLPAQVHVEKVRSVASAQRLLNFAILSYLLLIAGNVGTRIAVANNPNSILPLLFLPFALAVIGFVIFAVARMGYAMHGVWHAVIYGIMMLVPCLGLILLIILNSRVTNFLTRNGVKVGLMGAKMETVP